jgi:mRNA interferase RelE/StbE
VIPYDITFAPTASRALAARSLSRRAIDAAVTFIYGDLASYPKRVGKPLSGSLEGCWTARRGTYRVVYEIDDKDHVVRILHGAPRSHSYRPR